MIRSLAKTVIFEECSERILKGVSEEFLEGLPEGISSGIPIKFIRITSVRFRGVIIAGIIVEMLGKIRAGIS